MSTHRFASLSAILLAVLIGSAPILAGADPTPPTKPPTAESQSPATPHYGQDIQPIFDRRCIACHGCLGSPCNLKLDSFAGAQRGAFALNPYAAHLVDCPRTDMDAVGTLAGWRALGFYPVLTEEPSQHGTSAGNLNGSLMHRVLAAGSAFNQPGFSREALAPVYAGRYAYRCPSTVAALDAQLAQNPAQGMPFGLPALDGQDFDTLTRWIGAGAPGPTEPEQQAAARPAHPESVARWETFFNDPDPRRRLVSRYIYEHVYLASIVLEEDPQTHFRLVRSSTPPGEPVVIIGTALPYDDPLAYAGVQRFWYRLSYDWITAWNFSHRKAAAGYLDLSYCDVPD